MLYSQGIIAIPIKSGARLSGVDPDLVRTLKALSDASRLRIVALLADRPMAVEQLAEALRLSPGTVVHHLKRLRDAGLVEAHARHPYVFYSLELRRLQEIGRELDAVGRSVAPDASGPDPDVDGWSATDAKVLRSFFADGRLTTIPAQEKKKLVVLRYVAEIVFRERRAYPEKEVNQRLALLHPDVASLRRYLVDYGFMARERGEYHLQPRADWPAP